MRVCGCMPVYACVLLAFNTYLSALNTARHTSRSTFCLEINSFAQGFCILITSFEA